MLLAVDLGTILGGVGTLIASVVGAFALIQKHRTDHRIAETEGKKANSEETQQAFDLQDLAMQEVVASNSRLVAEIARVREKNDKYHDDINRILGTLGEVKARERRCQDDLNALGDRLRIAEARIAELGG